MVPRKYTSIPIITIWLMSIWIHNALSNGICSLKNLVPHFTTSRARIYAIADAFSCLPQHDSLEEKSPSTSMNNDFLLLNLIMMSCWSASWTIQIQMRFHTLWIMHLFNGWHDTQDHCIVCMIMVANLLDKDSNEFWNIITSRTYLQQWRNLKPMWFVNECIKQLETLWGPYAMHIHLKIFNKLRILLIQSLLLLLMQQEQLFIRLWKCHLVDWYFTKTCFLIFLCWLILPPFNRTGNNW
jgi:hypothetical protein